MTKEQLIISLVTLMQAQPKSRILYASPERIKRLQDMFAEITTEPNTFAAPASIMGLTLSPMFGSNDRYLYLSDGDVYTGFIDLGDE